MVCARVALMLADRQPVDLAIRDPVTVRCLGIQDDTVTIRTYVRIKQDIRLARFTQFPYIES
jgi:hypothetical protein